MPDSQKLDHVIGHYMSSGEVPVALVKQIWRDSSDRDELLEMIIENLQKSGSFGKVEFWMKSLALSLDCDEVASLYCELHVKSLRNELEWRSEFQKWFVACRDHLPPVEVESIRQFRLEDHLITAVENDDLDNVMLLCECMNRVGSNPSHTRVVSIEDIGLSLEQIEDMCVEELTALLDARRREAGVPIHAYARQLGRDRLIPFLGTD